MVSTSASIIHNISFRNKATGNNLFVNANISGTFTLSASIFANLGVSVDLIVKNINSKC